MRFIASNSFRFVFFFTFIFQTISCFAWGKKGHEIVVQIAQHYLNKGVMDSVQKYLGAMSIEEASDWLDEIKKNHRYQHIRPWHYVNIDKDETYVETRDPNVINQSQQMIKELSKPGHPWPSRNMALKVLLHLIGDLHQPLHVGYGYDRGGNDTKVKYKTYETNLHYLWDETIISEFNISTEECLTISSKYPAEKIKEIQSGDVQKWANDSRSNLPLVYNFKEGKIDKTYLKNSSAVTKELLVKAGLRLAFILNKIFSAK
jgi:hypothetical protein